MKIKRGPVIWSTYTLMIIAVITMAIIQGCSTLGYENADTTRKALLVAAAETRGTNLLLQDLIQRRAIGEEPARRALNSLQESKDLLQRGLGTIDATGDPTQAEGNLQRANLLISIALNILAPLAEGTN